MQKDRCEALYNLLRPCRKAAVKTGQNEEFVTIGKVLKPRGLRGEVKVLPLTDIPDRFEHLETVSVALTPSRRISLAIESVRYYKGCVYVFFQERHTVEDVQELLGKDLQVERRESPELPEGIYYHYEIVDAHVFTDENRYMGTVVEIIETGAHDVYVVKGDEQEYLIPATHEIVTHIDREKGCLIVHPIEGLFETD